jgi:aminopeptidase N
MRRWLGVLAALAALAGCTPVGDPPAPTLPTKPPGTPPPAPDGRSQPVADPVYPDYGNPAVDVLRYDLALAWDPSSRQLTGTATLTVRAVRELAEIALDFGSAYTVDRATVDGADARPVRRGGDLVLRAARPVARDATATVVVAYRGRPAPVPFPGARRDVSTLGLHVTPDGALWAMQEPYGAFTWYPCSDQPSDEAVYDIAITVPEGWAGVANGVLTGIQTGSVNRTYRWRAAEAMPTYLVTLAVDHFDRYDDVGPHGLPLGYWVRPQDSAAMLPTLRQSPRLLSWLERKLGPYPFGSAGVVVVQNTSGMETQTMVTLGAITGPAAVPVLLHEFAHHWFGDSVTPKTWLDMWLNEGFATYLQGLFELEERTVTEAGLIAAWRRIDTEQRAEAGPPGRYRADRFAARNVYVGPALMLHELRGLLGDPTFFAMLHDWVQHHRHTQQDRAGFTAWLRAYTGRDLTPVVDKWLDSRTTP